MNIENFCLEAGRPLEPVSGATSLLGKGTNEYRESCSQEAVWPLKFWSGVTADMHDGCSSCAQYFPKVMGNVTLSLHVR